ncbi:MAG: hypothetical protein ED557_10620 [Balneola sp.]|nr:MAG: hypothetical protein ED557_10620 [Balneola sp.]
MAQNKKHIPVEIPDNFLKMLFGLWVFFTLSLGATSTWVFTSLYTSAADVEKWWDGFLYSSIYSALFLTLFGMTWRWLLVKFPLQKPRALFFHGIAQSINSIIGFGSGFFITEAIHNLAYSGAHVPDEKSGIGLTVIALFCLIGILLTNGLFYASAYMRRSVEAERRRTESELSALRAQINPHFLFNSLNSIAALIRISPSEAESVTEDLADVFRYTLRASEHPLVPLKDELEIINLYLNIEKARFKDRIEIDIDVPESLFSVQVPVLTLQPLLENSIKHGVSKKEGAHTIRLEIKTVGEYIQLTVSDTGPGFPHHDFQRLLENGTGLSNVFHRLKLHFSDDVDAALSNNSLILRFPIQHTKPSTRFKEPSSLKDERIFS